MHNSYNLIQSVYVVLAGIYVQPNHYLYWENRTHRETIFDTETFVQT